jgi:hypothetical protein
VSTPEMSNTKRIKNFDLRFAKFSHLIRMRDLSMGKKPMCILHNCTRDQVEENFAFQQSFPGVKSKRLDRWFPKFLTPRPCAGFAKILKILKKRNTLEKYTKPKSSNKYEKKNLFTPQSFVCPRMRLYTNANTRSSIKESEPLNNYVYFNKMVQFAGWWVNVQCCFYHFWSYQMRRRPNSPFGRGVFCDGLLAVTSRRP